MKYAIFILIISMSLFLNACGDKFSRVDTIRGYTKVMVSTPPSMATLESFDLLKDISNFSDQIFTVPNKNILSILKIGEPIPRAHFIDTGTTATLSLQNGIYDFYAIGYSDAAITGNPSCGVATGIALNGTAVSVNLTMDATASTGPCDNASVGINANHGITTTLKPLSVAVCDETVTTVTSPTQSCATASSTIGSIKVGYFDDNVTTFDTPAGFLSSCSALTTGNSTTLPIFATGKFKIVVYTYTGTTCVAGNRVNSYALPKGLDAVAGTAGTETFGTKSANGITDLSDHALFTKNTGTVKLFIQSN